jgi:hypothetical protein
MSPLAESFVEEWLSIQESRKIGQHSATRRKREEDQVAYAFVVNVAADCKAAPPSGGPVT